MTDEELQHLLALRTKYLDRIQILEERKAEMGPAMPSSMEIELLQARRDLEAVEARMQTVPISRDLRQVIGRDAAVIVLEYRVKAIEDKLHDGMMALNSAINQVRELLVKALIVFGALFLTIVLALIIVERWR